MNRESKNLGIGLAIGASAGIITGLLLSNEKTQKATGAIKTKISDLASDAQERIKSMKSMVQKQEENLSSVISGLEHGAAGVAHAASGLSNASNTSNASNNASGASKNEPMASKYQKRGE